MNYGCIGERLGHSFSPEIHRLIGRYDYTLRELGREELADFLSAGNFRGVNVTIPYKQTVLPYLDRLSDRAAAIGAVNTIVNRQGTLWGYNTDFAGLEALIRRMGLELAGKKVLILGTGGTCKTARAVAEGLDAAQILAVSRTKKENAITYGEALALHTDADVIINTTPCGMYPRTEDCPIDLSSFRHLQGVVDVIFNPLASRLVLSARERGISSSGGLYMLVAQAVSASELFTDTACGADTTERIYRQLWEAKANLVLIGMPGSGKTTVGRKAAEQLGRPFVDLDEMVADRAGKPIPRLFVEDGEEAFRRLESDVIREAALQNGLVIATGGGSILRRENVRNLRLNGRLILLDRPLAQLTPTDDRPLSDSREKLKILYKVRRPLYQAAADAAVHVTGDVDATATAVITAFRKEITL